LGQGVSITDKIISASQLLKEHVPGLLPKSTPMTFEALL